MDATRTSVGCPERQAGGLTTHQAASILLCFRHAEILVYASTNHLYGWFQEHESGSQLQERTFEDMKRVGVLVGREKTFPEAIIKGINERGKGAVIAEYIKLGGIRDDAPPKYDLVIDRISHEVPFYRATLKRMALEGTIIVKQSILVVR
jgi:hypothetical protein